MGSRVKFFGEIYPALSDSNTYGHVLPQ